MTLCNSLFFLNAKIIEMVSKLVVLGIKGGLRVRREVSMAIKGP